MLQYTIDSPFVCIQKNNLCVEYIPTGKMNSTKVQNPRHKMQVALLAEPKTLEYYEQ